MARCQYYNSLGSKKKKGMIMVTRSAIYIFRNRMMRGISLRHVFSALKCSTIEQSNETIIFTMPRSVKDANDANLFDFSKDDNDMAKDNFIKDDENKNNYLSDDNTLQKLDIESSDDESLSYDSDENDDKKKKKKTENYMEKYNIPENDFKLRVDTSKAAELVYMLVEILQETLYGVTNPYIMNQKPIIKLDLQRPQIPAERPKHSLKRRALFLSHYDPNPEAGKIFQYGRDKLFDETIFDIIFDPKSRRSKHTDIIENLKTGLDMCEYFKSNWDGGPILTIGREFHPTVFGNAFGRAVGWESSLTTVVFRSSSFSHFPQFLKSLISYSENIDKIIFLDYERGRSLKFDLAIFNEDSFKKEDTTIKKWWFLNCSNSVIIPFLRTSYQLTKPFDELVISRYSYSEEDAKRIFYQIQTVPILSCTKSIKFLNLKFKSFPYLEFKSMCTSFQCLQTLYLKSFSNCDGNIIMSAIFNASPLIRQISLINMRFELNMQKDLPIPEGLIFLDVSKSTFINSAFVSFLSGITYQPVTTPFIFSARKLKIGDNELDFLKTLEFKKCNPNFSEVNLSYNRIPILDKPNLFDFISTQTKLKQIILNEVTTDDQIMFIKEVVDLCSNTKAEGLDIGVHFEGTLVQMFITLLSRCESLTRLSINNCGAGNDGLIALCSLFNLLKNLRELSCDGFRPKPMTDDEIAATRNHEHPLIELWKMIGESKQIERNDFPKQDLITANLQFIATSQKDDIWIHRLESRKLPKTQQERIQEILDRISKRDEKRRAETFKKLKKRKSQIRKGFTLGMMDDYEEEEEEEFEEEEEEEESNDKVV